MSQLVSSKEILKRNCKNLKDCKKDPVKITNAGLKKLDRDIREAISRNDNVRHGSIGEAAGRYMK